MSISTNKDNSLVLDENITSTIVSQIGSNLILNLEEWKEYNPEKFPELKNLMINEDPILKKHINELNKSKRVVVLELKDGLYIKTKQYIGFLQLGNIKLIIRPKINKFDLMQLIIYVFNLHKINLQKTTYNFNKMGFVDLLIMQLDREIRKLSSKGLIKNYELKEQNLSTIRGKLDIKKIVNRGGIRNAQIPCRYYNRSENGILNQILISGLKLGIQLTNIQELRIDLIQLYKSFEMTIDPIKLNLTIFKLAKANLNRLSRAYEPIINLVFLLWSRNIPNIYGKYEELPLPGFLLDMNKFFEDLLSKFLKESLYDCDVKPQYNFSDMISYDPKFNPKKRQMKRRIFPDIVIFKESECIAVLDAKYRDLWDKNIPIKWLYQLCVYSMNPMAKKKSIIVYPSTNEEASDVVIEVKNPKENTKFSTVIIRPLKIPQLKKVLNSKDQKLKKQFAYKLISYFN